MIARIQGLLSLHGQVSKWNKQFTFQDVWARVLVVFEHRRAAGGKQFSSWCGNQLPRAGLNYSVSSVPGS